VLGWYGRRDFQKSVSVSSEVCCFANCIHGYAIHPWCRLVVRSHRVSAVVVCFLVVAGLVYTLPTQWFQSFASRVGASAASQSGVEKRTSYFGWFRQ
jgi:hypothetical protein